MDTVSRTSLAVIMASFSLIFTLLMGTAPALAYADGAADPVATNPDDKRASAIPLLVLVAGFDGGDDPASAVAYRDDYDWASYTFGSQDSVSSYYVDMSGGLFAFTPAHETSQYGVDGNTNEADMPNDGVVHVTLHSQHDGWATVNEDLSVTSSFCWKAMEALEAASSYVDFASYDTDGDGNLEDDELVLVLCIAGYEASAMSSYRTTDLPVIWAHSGNLEIIGTPGCTLDKLKFGPYLAFAEQYWNDNAPLDTTIQQPVGMLCHELGHTLGLPDLYAIDDGTGDATWGQYTVGALSLMAEGCMVHAPEDYGAKFYRPGSLDAWSRHELGWVTPTRVTESGDYQVSSQLSENGYTQLLIPTLDPDRYYLVENRQPEGYDEYFQTSYADAGELGGIVVWVVDESLCRQLNASNTVNSPSHHPGVVPLYYETEGGAYSQDWAASEPSLDEPFYASGSWADRFGEGTVLELPAYGADDVPWARVDAGVSISFPAEPSRDMTVHVDISEPLHTALLKDELTSKVSACVHTLFGAAA